MADHSLTEPVEPVEPGGTPAALHRRNLLAGLGALGGGIVASGVLAGTADAQVPATAPPAIGGPGTRGTSVSSTIASPHQPGVTYLYRAEFDFSPESSVAHRQFGGTGGVHATGAATSLWTSVDLPRGAKLFDIEWYAMNTSGGPATGGAWLWTANSGFLNVEAVRTTISSGAGTRAVRTVAGSENNGPFPAGCRLLLGMYTPTSGTIQVNGVRVGYKPGSLGMQFLPTPIRAYDSRSGAPFAPNETRTISLASAIPEGAVGAVISLSITGCQGKGTLRLGAGGAVPPATAIQWSRTGDQVTTAANTALDGSRRIAVRSTGSTGTTHVIVDVVGYLA